jgi:broad specificity phosphatase PhoE
MRLILVRHAQTDLNTKRVYQGVRLDYALNEVGREQAKKTSEFLKDYKFDLILSSPLKRAIETAEIINEKHNNKIILMESITERDFGEFDGQSYDDINYKKVREDDSYNKYGVESPKCFQKRVEDFLEDVHGEHYGKTILVVSHGGTLKMLLSILQNIDWEVGVYSIKKPNASISIIELDEKKDLKSIDVGSIKHLLD